MEATAIRAFGGDGIGRIGNEASQGQDRRSREQVIEIGRLSEEPRVAGHARRCLRQGVLLVGR
jgi:hypothetical protein